MITQKVLNFYIKNKVDENAINNAKIEYWSNSRAFYFFNPQPTETKEFFCNCGYLPSNQNDANNFVNSISQLNEKTDYNIDYAFKDVLPKEKYFSLNQQNFLYAFYPRVWKNLAVEDRIVCLNFAYKYFLNEYNLKNNYRLVWFNEEYVPARNGALDNFNKTLYLNFNCVLTYPGLALFSIIAHEVNHLKQMLQANNMVNSKKLSNLSTYEQCLHSKNWLILNGDANKIKNFLSPEFAQKYDDYKDTFEWKKFVNNFYRYDYLEFSSRNIQYKQLLKHIKMCYDFYNDILPEDSLLYGYCKDLKANTTKQIKQKQFDFDINEYNKFKVLCGCNQERINHLSKVTNLFFKDKYHIIPTNVKTAINLELERHIDLQRKIYTAFIQAYENNGLIPKSFDRINFNEIDFLIKSQNETVNQTIDFYDNLINKKNNEQNL